MEVEIEVTKCWTVYEEEPDLDRDYPGYDGRVLVLHGTASINRDVYYSDAAEALDGAECRVYLRAVDGEVPTETAVWSKNGASWRVFFSLNLKRLLWEDFWRRTFDPLPKITIRAQIMEVECTTDSLEVPAGLRSIEILS